ncbi:Rieske 2Fe-2S domain-containing protein [Sphingomonas sp. MMS24-JH45]
MSVTSIVPSSCSNIRAAGSSSLRRRICRTRSRPRSTIGCKMVGYRDSQGKAVVMDAICPHMGAHLGHGGTIEGDTIKCPFHHWEFGPTGKCTKIPYSKIIPPAARCRHLSRARGERPDLPLERSRGAGAEL